MRILYALSALIIVPIVIIYYLIGAVVMTIVDVIREHVQKMHGVRNE